MTSLVDLLAAVPSVVYGLWGVIVLAPWLAGVYGRVSDFTAPIPVVSSLFAGPSTGRGLFTAGIILALMVTPIVTSITREVFDTVPTMAKEAAYALGATRWEMIRAAVFPTAGRASSVRSCSASAGPWGRRSPPLSSSGRARNRREPLRLR